MARRICSRHTALLSAGMRSEGVAVARVAEKLGATGEPQQGERCPICDNGASDGLVTLMGSVMGNRMVRAPRARES